MNTKNSKSPSTVQTPNGTTSSKKITVKQHPETMELILKKIDTLQNLKDYYTRLKVKKSQLENAISQITSYKEPAEDKFEQDRPVEFPFRVILQYKEDHRWEDIFRINQKLSVIRHSKELLDDVNQILEAFEKDIQNHAKEFK